jgi:hypothetical protein
MIRERDRHARHARHKAADLGCHWQAFGYDHMIQEQGLQLKKVPKHRDYDPHGR